MCDPRMRGTNDKATRKLIEGKDLLEFGSDFDPI